MYSIGEFSKLVNRSVKTLQRWDHNKIFIAKRSPSGRRYYSESQLLEYKGLKASAKSKNIAYCRVSNKNQLDDLKNQKKFVSEFCLHRGVEIDDWYEDVGSGLNYNRKMFNRLISNVEHGLVKNIIIAHKDRFIRFGYEWFERFCESHGCNILIINDEKLSPESELVQDLINIIHVFSCRIYGLRNYKKKIKKEFSK